MNASTKDGLGTALRAAQIGSYFTEDAVVELGEGAAPIKGRDTLMGMVARLQPRKMLSSISAAERRRFRDATH